MTKKLLSFLLSLICLVALSSCSGYNNGPSNMKANFYYLRSSTEYNAEDGLIYAENRSVAEYSSDEDWTKFINMYLNGPIDDNYISPFPEGTTLQRYSINDNTITVFLSNQISQLEGYDLTLACACLTKTIMAAKPVHAVEIRAEGGKMGDFISFTMTEESLLLFDNYSLSEIN